jgi:calcineurin-like phosphoesterase family protein
MPKTFYTSDLHFSHANIIIYCNRPWLQEGDLVSCDRRGHKWISRDVALQRAAEMDEVLIGNWNSVICPEDTVWVLGDFMMTGSVSRVESMLARLNGNKHLIIGNHDLKMSKSKILSGWESVRKSVVINLAGKNILMEHKKRYPFNTDWMLHGHSHRTTNIMSGQGGRAIDIGIDGNNYMPYSEQDIIDLIRD